MLEQVLTHLKNWFLVSDGVHEGTYTIEDGGITLPFLKSGQYFRILGSVFNDGLYEYFDGMAVLENGSEAVLTDETFDGVIWALAIPKAIISLAKEIEAWQEKYGESVTSPYTSESFGGYAYTKAANESTGAALTWQDVFSPRLNPYKRPRELGFVKPNSWR